MYIKNEVKNLLCKFCNTEFLQNRSNQKYCSKQCKKRLIDKGRTKYKKTYGSEYYRIYKEKNYDILLEKARVYRKKQKNTPQYIYRRIVGGAKHRGISHGITAEEFIEWYLSQEKICSYCGILECELVDDILNYADRRRGKMDRLTIDRVINSVGYEIGNLALACFRCNFIKSSVFSYEEMKKIGDAISSIRKGRG